MNLRDDVFNVASVIKTCVTYVSASCGWSIDKMLWCHYILCLWPPSACCHVVGQVVFGVCNKIDVPNAAASRFDDRLVFLDSGHRLQILQQLRTMLMSLTTRWPTIWRQQHWPQRAIANDRCWWHYRLVQSWLMWAELVCPRHVWTLVIKEVSDMLSPKFVIVLMMIFAMYIMSNATWFDFNQWHRRIVNRGYMWNKIIWK